MVVVTADYGWDVSPTPPGQFLIITRISTHPEDNPIYLHNCHMPKLEGVTTITHDLDNPTRQHDFTTWVLYIRKFPEALRKLVRHKEIRIQGQRNFKSCIRLVVITEENTTEAMWKAVHPHLLTAHNIDQVMTVGCTFRQEAEFWDEFMDTLPGSLGQTHMVRESPKWIALGAATDDFLTHIRDYLPSNTAAVGRAWHVNRTGLGTLYGQVRPLVLRPSCEGILLESTPICPYITYDMVWSWTQRIGIQTNDIQVQSSGSHTYFQLHVHERHVTFLTAVQWEILAGGFTTRFTLKRHGPENVVQQLAQGVLNEEGRGASQTTVATDVMMHDRPAQTTAGSVSQTDTCSRTTRRVRSMTPKMIRVALLPTAAATTTITTTAMTNTPTPSRTVKQINNHKKWKQRIRNSHDKVKHLENTHWNWRSSSSSRSKSESLLVVKSP